MKKVLIVIISSLFVLFLSTQKIYAVGLGDIVGPDYIWKERDEIISITDIIALYSASDGFVYALEDNYTNYGHVLGEHKIILGATDGVFEKSKEITVRVTMGMIPDIDGSNLFRMVGKTSSSVYYFVVNDNKTVTSENIAETLINLSQLTVIKPMQRQIILDEYTENKTEAGSYSYNFRILDASGQIKTITSRIIVNEISDEWDDFNPDNEQPLFNLDLSKVWDIALTIIGVVIAGAIIIAGFIGVKKVIRKVKS